jgi:hypothetical protein
MRSSMLLIIGLVVWTAQGPPVCRAQSDVAPDQFEETDVVPLTQPPKTGTLNSDPAPCPVDSPYSESDGQTCRASSTSQHHDPSGALLRFNFFGYAVMIQARKYQESPWDQIRTKLLLFTGKPLTSS